MHGGAAAGGGVCGPRHHRERKRWLRLRFGSRAAGGRRALRAAGLLRRVAARRGRPRRVPSWLPGRRGVWRCTTRYKHAHNNEQTTTHTGRRPRRAAAAPTAVRAVFADADLRRRTSRRRGGATARTGPRRILSGGPGTGGSTRTFLGQLDAAARDAAFAAHEHRAAWLGAAARRAERVAQQACAAMGFAAPETASPPPPPPPKAVQPPPPTRGEPASGAPTRASRRGSATGRGTSGGRRTNRGRGGLARVRQPRRGGEGSRPGVCREAPAQQAARFAAGAGARGRATGGRNRRRGRSGGKSRLRGRLARAPARRRRAPRRVSRRVFFVAAGVVFDGCCAGGASGRVC